MYARAAMRPLINAPRRGSVTPFPENHFTPPARSASAVAAKRRRCRKATRPVLLGHCPTPLRRFLAVDFPLHSEAAPGR
jgi:hypothetical protein